MVGAITSYKPIINARTPYLSPSILTSKPRRIVSDATRLINGSGERRSFNPNVITEDVSENASRKTVSADDRPCSGYNYHRKGDLED